MCVPWISGTPKPSTHGWGHLFGNSRCFAIHSPPPKDPPYCRLYCYQGQGLCCIICCFILSYLCFLLKNLVAFSPHVSNRSYTGRVVITVVFCWAKKRRKQTNKHTRLIHLSCGIYEATSSKPLPNQWGLTIRKGTEEGAQLKFKVRLFRKREFSFYADIL